MCWPFGSLEPGRAWIHRLSQFHAVESVTHSAQASLSIEVPEPRRSPTFESQHVSPYAMRSPGKIPFEQQFSPKNSPNARRSIGGSCNEGMPPYSMRSSCFQSTSSQASLSPGGMVVDITGKVHASVPMHLARSNCAHHHLVASPMAPTASMDMVVSAVARRMRSPSLHANRTEPLRPLDDRLPALLIHSGVQAESLAPTVVKKSPLGGKPFPTPLRMPSSSAAHPSMRSHARERARFAACRCDLSHTQLSRGRWRETNSSRATAPIPAAQQFRRMTRM